MFKPSTSFAGRLLNQGNQPANITVDPNTFRTIVGNQLVNPSSSFHLDPSVLGSLLTGGIASSGSGGTMPAPGGPPVDIQALLAMIPVVNDGDVITSDSYNLLRSALIAIANQLGVTPTGGQTGTLTFLPTFFQNSTGPNWVQTSGIASPPQGGTANGWLPLQLPQGVRIQSMTVIGRKNGDLDLFQVNLVRQAIADSSAITTLVGISLKNATDPFTVTKLVSVLGAGPAALNEFSTVDITQYKYFVTAEVDNAKGVANIETIQISYQS